MTTKTEKKVGKVMREFTKGKLHSGSKKGPAVTSKKQALAIGYAEARKNLDILVASNANPSPPAGASTNR